MGEGTGAVAYRTGEDRPRRSPATRNRPFRPSLRLCSDCVRGPCDGVSGGSVGAMSAARAARYLLDEGPHRREQAVELARGIVADELSPADEVVQACVVLRRAGLIDEAVAAAGVAAARGADVPPDVLALGREAGRRRRGPFSRAA